MKCVVGLGNPGRKYKDTRHNIGFMVIDEILNRLNEKSDKLKFNCEYAVTMMSGEKVLLVKPQTFMNLSGEGVRPLIDYYNISPEDTLVIYDDLDLPIGKIRLRQKGSAGGHNGIKSLIEHLGTKEFKRLRIGIGRPSDRTPIVNYVLQPFSKEERADVDLTIKLAADACETWMEKDFNDVMNEFNK